MLDFCERVVERLGSAWACLGWIAFLAVFFMPWIVPAEDTIFHSTRGAPMLTFAAPRIASLLLLIGWWTVDAIDQQVKSWQVAAGLVMVGLGFLPLSGVLPLAAWILYWTRVRE